MHFSLPGFSLLEAIVAMSILFMVGSAGAIVTFSEIGKTNMAQDGSTIRASLREARAFSQYAVNGLSYHGVHLNSRAATMFSGLTYQKRSMTNDVTYLLNGFDPIAAEQDIVFFPVLGTVSNDTSITITNHSSERLVIHISQDGTIDSP